MSVGYVYGLSKRTSVYGTYSYLKQKDFNGGVPAAAMYTLGTGGLKDSGKQQGFQVGVSHSF